MLWVSLWNTQQGAFIEFPSFVMIVIKNQHHQRRLMDFHGVMSAKEFLQRNTLFLVTIVIWIIAIIVLIIVDFSLKMCLDMIFAVTYVFLLLKEINGKLRIELGRCFYCSLLSPLCNAFCRFLSDKN